MRLQVRLTLWSILVMTAVVSSVSAMEMIQEVNRQFELLYRHTLSIHRFVVLSVDRAIARNPRPSVEAGIQADLALSEQLLDLLSENASLVEIAVCDPKLKILADSDRFRTGETFTISPDLAKLAHASPWWEKLEVLRHGQQAYEVSTEGAGKDDAAPGLVTANTSQKIAPKISVHVVFLPALLRSGDENVVGILLSHLWFAGASILAAVVAVLILSATAFRPLGKLGEMLDLLAQGEYEMRATEPAAGQFDAVASKVNMLGKALKGARSEMSDLRGNVERILDDLEDAVLIFGRDRRLIAAAGAVEQYLARPRGELMGLSLGEIFPPGATLGLLLAQATQTSRPIRNRRVPLQVEGRPSMSMALLSVEFLEAAGGGGMVIRLRDPEATRKIGRELQIADRVSAIGRLTGGVAHEVKNPLNAMLMHVELAKMKLSHGDFDLEPQMEVISSEILRLDRVVKTFLDFTRPVELHPAEVQAQALIQEIASLATPQAEAGGIAISVLQSEDPIVITVDSDLIKQAILNIVVNAIEAMPDGGTLRIESSLKGDAIEVRITDSGPGIPPDMREKIYNLYFTTKTHGSGIGLAMTFQIIQLHDGTIDFASEPGKGTTFIIRLPVAAVTA